MNTDSSILPADNFEKENIKLKLSALEEANNKIKDTLASGTQNIKATREMLSKI